MRYDKGQKAATRQHIVAVAAEKFRAEGIEGAGIAGLMAEAGLTHGGFYAHFASKEELVRAAMAAAFDGSRLQTASGLEALVRSYLRPAHRDNPAQGCMIAPLVAEIARHPEETRAAFTARLTGLLDKIAAQLPADAAGQQQTAIGILSVMLGSLQMSRAVTDGTLSQAILDAGITVALQLAVVKESK
jgi:AcrR family transcriptional regulator